MKFKQSKNTLGYIEAFPKPTKEFLENHYSKKYFQHPQGSYSKKYSKDEKLYFKNNAKIIHTVSKRIGLKRRSFIDVGCGEGFFASYFKKNNWRVFCNDYSDFGIKKFNKHLINDFYSGDADYFLKNLKDLTKTPGLILFSHVLEHVIDPLQFLKNVSSTIDDKSIVCTIVPNDYSDYQKHLLNKKLTRNTWFSPPEHLNYFNNSNIYKIFKNANLKIVKMLASFPIEIFISNSNSNYSIDKSIGYDAHKSRILNVNFFVKNDLENYISYLEACANIGFGRTLTIFAKKDKN